MCLIGLAGIKGRGRSRQLLGYSSTCSDTLEADFKKEGEFWEMQKAKKPQQN